MMSGRNLKIISSLFCLFAYFVLFSSEISVFVLNTTDLHSSLENTPDEFGRVANILKLSSLIQNEKSSLQLKGHNFILIDCGDILQGSFEAMYSQGELGMLFLKSLNYDVWVPGNHDFDFGLKRFEELTTQLNTTQILAVNLNSKVCNKWTTLELNGLKICIIGATVPYLLSFNITLPEELLKNLDDELEEIIPQIMREKPHAIILAIHHGVFTPVERGGIDLTKIARRYPQINLFLGGHSHEEVSGIKIGPASWFVQAGAHAKTLAKIEMIFDGNEKRLIDIRSCLLDVKIDFEGLYVDKRMQEIIHEAAKEAKEIVGSFIKPVLSSPEDQIESEIREFVSSAIAFASGAEIVMSSIIMRNPEITDKLTRAQVFKILPHEDNICTLELTPEQMKEILTEQIKNLQTRHCHLPWGLRCVFKENQVISMELPDGKIWSESRKKVAFSSFALSGAGGRFPILAQMAKNPDCKFKDTSKRLRDAVIEFSQKNSPLEFSKNRWIIIE